MGHISRLMILASVIACCFSYFIDWTKTMQVPQLTPSVSDFSEVPTKFMNRLIASLSPEELEELRKPIIPRDSNLHNRDGNTEEKRCPSYKHTQYYHSALGIDGEEYWVITSELEQLQPTIYYACYKHGPQNNSCNAVNPIDKHLHCCHERQAPATMAVIPLPKSFLDNKDGDLLYNDTRYENYTRTKKEVWVKSECNCVEYLAAIAPDDTCPSPESKLLDLYS